MASVTIPQLLALLREKQFSVSLAGEMLSFKGDAAALSEAERALLEARRGDILLYLKAHKATSMPVLRADEDAPRPSQSQESWWRWIRESPVQLSHERIPAIRSYAGVTGEEARGALARMVTRHHVLRSRFREVDGVLSLRLNPPGDSDVEIEHVPAELAPEAARALAQRRAEEFVGQPLPVDGPWLIKAKVIVPAPGDVVIAVLFAHMIVDGLSSQFLIAELDTSLAGTEAAKAAREAPPAQFLDYAASEQAWLQGPDGAALTDYWLNWLGRQTPLRAPAGGAALAWQHGINVSHAFTIARGARDAVQALGARHRTSAFFVLLTLYAMALARWSGQAHFAIRSVGNMRRTQALASLVGFMVCIDPIEVQAPADADFASVLKFITTEYYNAAMLRLPGFLKFPAQSAHPGIENIMLTESIAATFNFMPGRRQPAGAPAQLVTWPPAIEGVTREPWAALLWPIYLRLVDVGDDTKGLFQFNEALIAPAQQAALMTHFFALIEETALAAPAA